MALKINIENTVIPPYLRKLIDINLEDEWLYLKIDYVSGNAELTSITLSTTVIIDEGSNDGQHEFYTRNLPLPVSHYSFVPDLRGPNFIEQGYEYLKTLPEFEGCEDC